MDQLVWCGRIRNGISLTAPNETLASAYLKKAEEALETMQTIPRSRLEDNDRILRDVLLPLCCPHADRDPVREPCLHHPAHGTASLRLFRSCRGDTRGKGKGSTGRCPVLRLAGDSRPFLRRTYPGRPSISGEMHWHRRRDEREGHRGPEGTPDGGATGRGVRKRRSEATRSLMPRPASPRPQRGFPSSRRPTGPGCRGPARAPAREGGPVPIPILYQKGIRCRPHPRQPEELTLDTEITYSATTSSSIRRGAAYNEREP